MGEADRNGRQSASETIAAQQAAARRAERRRQMAMVGGSIVAVLAIVAAFIGYSAFHKSGTAAAAKSVSAVESEITSVPASTLNAVGKGKASALFPVSGAPALTAQGKPEILFAGAEYCPYCAAERWALTVALSRFGTFSGLHFIHSSSTDSYPSTPTLTFYKSSYTSKYLTFEPVEWYGETPDSSSPVGYAPLQNPTAAQQALVTKYETPPYVPAAVKDAFPYVDIGNKYLVAGAQYLPSVLHGLTWAQVAAAIKNPSSAVAKDIDGAANIITAAICKVTNNKPGAVCSSAAAQAGMGGL
jgi:thiol-disulfide isomerase/thioredoxin